MALQPDDKPLLGGLFTEVNGQTRTAIARLNPDGMLDSMFVPIQFPVFSEASIGSLVVQTNGGVIVSGNFPSVNGHTNILRLNPDGTLDSRFVTVYGSAQLVLQPNQQLLVGGTTRIWGIDFPPLLQSMAKSGTTVNLTWYAIPDRAYEVQYTGELSVGGWTNWPGHVVVATGDIATPGGFGAWVCGANVLSGCRTAVTQPCPVLQHLHVVDYQMPFPPTSHCLCRSNFRNKLHAP